MVKIIIHVGASYSGACISVIDDYMYMKYVYHNGIYNTCEEPTLFWVNKSLLNDPNNEMRVLSSVQSDTPNPNLVWTRNSISKKLNEINDDSNWVRFSRFTMDLSEDHKTVKGSDGLAYDRAEVIKLFLRVIKSDCMYKLRLLDFESEILWAVIISTFGDYNQITIMRNLLSDVFPRSPIILSEKACTINGMLAYANREYRGMEFFKKGRNTLIVDTVVGSIDLVCGDDGVIRCRETRRLAGDNEIDSCFWQLMVRCMVEQTGKKNENFPIQALWSDFEKENPQGAMKMKDSWLRIKHHSCPSLVNGGGIWFSFSVEYLLWLRSRGLNRIHEMIMENFGQLWISRERIEKECFSPFIETIKNAVHTFMENYRFQYLIILGRMYVCEQLRDAIQSLDSNKCLYITLIDSNNLPSASLIGGTYLLKKSLEYYDNIMKPSPVELYGRVRQK